MQLDTIKTLDIILNAIEARSWPNGTQADVLSVVEDETIPAETWRTKGYGLNAVRHEMRRRGEQVSALAIERLRAMGIPAQVTIMRGDPAFLIPFAAQNWSSDLILIRANNRIDFRNWLLGSVAKSVVESADYSVEVVRAPIAPQSSATQSGVRILLATDGSDAAVAASQAVSVIGDEERSELQRLMSRATAVAVANRAHCSVRVVRRNNASRDKPLPLSGLKTERDTSAEYRLDSLSNAA